jgi:hypothetical protein
MLGNPLRRSVRGGWLPVAAQKASPAAVYAGASPVKVGEKDGGPRGRPKGGWGFRGGGGWCGAPLKIR